MILYDETTDAIFDRFWLRDETVDDQLALIRALTESVYGKPLERPLTRAELIGRMDDSGFADVLLRVEPDRFLAAVIAEYRTDGADDRYDFLMTLTCEEGNAYDCIYDIVGVSRGGLLIKFTTNVVEGLPMTAAELEAVA